MTQHALQQLTERFSKYDAERLLQEIEKAVLSGDARYIAETVMLGETVYSYQLQDGTFAFPVIAEGEDDFSVITVLSEGMEVSTSTGNITLKAEYLDPGLHTEISETRYHGDLLSRQPSLSSTLARKLTTQSPLHAWTAHPRLNPDHEPVQKRSFDVGRAAHSVVLGRGAPFEAYPPKLLASNGAASTKAAKEWAEAKRADGVTPLKQDDFDAVHAMATTLETKLAELGVRFDADRSEIVALTEIDDVMCRAMLDNAPAEPSAPIYDFKTCESAAPDACMRAVMNYGYDVQAAHYLETWAAVTGEERVLRFVFQEK
ncbi:MAG: PD-(D/E)XK nuclease-like domain-containing protein, partial [Verrucomicrobiota bacterium]